MTRFLNFLCAVLLTAGLTVVGGAGSAKAEKLTLRLDFAPWGIHAAMHLAKEKGWFKQAGIEVDVQDGKGTLNTIQLVAAGQIDVGQVQLGPMAVAREKGLPVKSFAGFARKGDLAVLVDAAKGPKDITELKGKKLVTFAFSPWVPFIDAYLKTAGLDRSSVKVTMVAPPAMVPSFASGDVDGFMSLAPFGEPLVAKTRPARSLLLADAGIAFPSYGLIATEDTIAKRADDLQKLADVQVRAWEYIYNGHIDEAVAAILSQRPDTRLPAAALKGQVEAYRRFFHTKHSQGLKFGVQTEKDWMDAIASMERAGVIKAGHKPSEYYTNKLLSK